MTPMVALNQAYHAWIRTQPQLILNLWDEDGLEEGDASRCSVVALLEPALPPSLPQGAGSTQDATEPRYGTPDGLTAARTHRLANSPAEAAPARTGASVASLAHEGPGRMTSESGAAGATGGTC
jgi:hypothetical protein